LDIVPAMDSTPNSGGGARGILDDVLPEVGVWTGPELTPAQKMAKEHEASQSVVRALAKPPDPTDLTTATSRYLYWTPADRSGVWPACEEHSFIRDLGGEIVAVKRPAYYAAIYVGKPAPSDFYIRRKEEFRSPLPDDAENRSGQIKLSRVTPYLGGGLTLFWTPNYGSAVLGATGHR